MINKTLKIFVLKHFIHDSVKQLLHCIINLKKSINLKSKIKNAKVRILIV